MLSAGFLPGQKQLYQSPNLLACPKLDFMQAEDGTLWLASETGVLYFDGLDWQKFEAGSFANSVRQIVWTLGQDTENTIWFSRPKLPPLGFNFTNRLDSFELSQEAKKRFGQSTILDICMQGDTMLLATDNGLFVVSKQKNIIGHHLFHQAFPKVKHGTLSPDILRCVRPDAEQPGKYWVAGVMGLARINLSNGQWEHFPMPLDLLKPSLVPLFSVQTHHNFLITDLLQHQGNIYTATWGGGLMVFDTKLQTWSQKLYQDIGPNVPLDENITSRLALIGDSMVVATTVQYKRPIVWHIPQQRFLSFESVFGQIPSYDNSDAIILLGNQLWIGNHNSVERYTLASSAMYKQDKFKPRVAQIVQDDKTLYRFSVQPTGAQQPVSLEHGMVKVIFAQLPQTSQIYEYQILGIDDTLRTGFEASYVLNGGSHVLQYRVKGQTQWASLELFIPKFWYEKKALMAILILALTALVFGIVYRVMHNRTKKLKAKLELSNTMLELERRALQAQMNPHFLFNSLVSIKSFIVENDRRKATDFINEFAAFVRQLLNYSQLDSISLSEELEMIQLYLNIEQKRFRTAFQYNLQVEDGISLNDIPMPSLLLQPFVENALWHGIMHVDYPGQIDVKIAREGAFLCINIIDNGMGISKSLSQKSVSSKQKSYGSSISQKRLVNYFGPQASISIQDRSDMSGTIVCIKILWNSIHEKRVHHV
jgi:hypothetical protein